MWMQTICLRIESTIALRYRPLSGAAVCATIRTTCGRTKQVGVDAMTTDSTLAEFDQEVGGECPPELYPAQQAATGVSGFASIGDEQIALFHEQGYLVIHDAFTGTEVASALAGLVDLIGGVYSTYRGIQYEKNGRDLVATLPGEQRQD